MVKKIVWRSPYFPFPSLMQGNRINQNTYTSSNRYFDNLWCITLYFFTPNFSAGNFSSEHFVCNQTKIFRSHERGQNNNFVDQEQQCRFLVLRSRILLPIVLVAIDLGFLSFKLESDMYLCPPPSRNLFKIATSLRVDLGEETYTRSLWQLIRDTAVSYLLMRLRYWLSGTKRKLKHWTNWKKKWWNVTTIFYAIWHRLKMVENSWSGLTDVDNSQTTHWDVEPIYQSQIHFINITVWLYET